MAMGRFCSRRLATATPETTVAEAATRMVRLGVGTLVVLGVDGEPIGTLTEREILARLVACDLPPGDTFVVEIMTTPVSREFLMAFESHEGGGGGNGRDSILMEGPYETLQGLVALDDALTLVDSELARRSGNGKGAGTPR
jgi:CBS domain-containing protein